MANVNPLSNKFTQILREKLADSLTAPFPPFTPRRLFGSLQFPGKATAIVGMRRSGKTTLLHQIRQQRLNQGVDRRALPYINFEDERLSGLTAEHLSQLVDEHTRRFSGSNVSWCFDEIQVVPGWERFVRRLLDENRGEIFITGSSAALLSREIATTLRGRAWEVPLYPFSFAEVLQHRGNGLPRDLDLLTTRERLQFEQIFREWLETGGFPEAQNLPAFSRYQLLSDYVDVAMLRDVVERHDVRNVTEIGRAHV